MAENRLSRNARPGLVRFFLFLAFAFVGSWIAVPSMGLARGLLVGFDIGAAYFVLDCMRLVFVPEHDVRQAAESNDPTRGARLIIQIILAAVVFAALTALINDRASLDLPEKLLIVITLGLVWAFANAAYMLHYAFLYYQGAPNDPPADGLKFPGKEPPDIGDFAYFAFTIGGALQTADVAITSRRIRRVVFVHQIVAFFFNIGVLALVISAISSA